MLLFVYVIFFLREGSFPVNDKVLYIPLTRGQARLLLKLLDAFAVVFGSDTPLQINGIRNKVYEAVYPDAHR